MVIDRKFNIFVSYTVYSFFLPFPASQVLDVCQQPNSRIITETLNETMYIHSPQFPRRKEYQCGTSKCDCVKEFYFEDFMVFNFSIQHVDLDSKNDYVKIESISNSGNPTGNSKNWTGRIHELQTYSMLGYGFKITFIERPNSIRFGFLISFSGKYLPFTLRHKKCICRRGDFSCLVLGNVVGDDNRQSFLNLHIL